MLLIYSLLMKDHMTELDFASNVQEVHFGSWVLTPRRQTICDGEVEKELEPLLYKILSFLILHRDRIVPRDELVQEVWQQNYVDDNAINRAVSELRKTLKSEKQTGIVVKTHYRKGYSFILDVEIKLYNQATDEYVKAKEGAKDPKQQGLDVDELEVTADYEKPTVKTNYRKFAIAALCLITIFMAFSFYTREANNSTPGDLQSVKLTLSEEPYSLEEGYFIRLVGNINRTYVAYGFQSARNSKEETHITDPDTNESIRLAEEGFYIVPITWSLDGSTLYYHRYSDDNDCEVWNVKLDSIKQVNQHAKIFSCKDKYWLSGAEVGDGQFVYTKSGFRGNEQVRSLYSIDLKTLEEYRITTPPILEKSFGDFFVTSINYKNEVKLVYSRYDGSQSTIYIANSNGERSESIATINGLVSHISTNSQLSELTWVRNKLLYSYSLITKNLKIKDLVISKDIESLINIDEHEYLAISKNIGYATGIFDLKTAEKIENKNSLLNEAISTEQLEVRLLATESKKSKVWFIADDSPYLLNSYAKGSVKDLYLEHENKNALVIHEKGFQVIEIESKKIISEYHDQELNVSSGARLSATKIALFLINGSLLIIDTQTNSTEYQALDTEYKFIPFDESKLFVKSKHNHFQLFDYEAKKYKSLFQWQNNSAITDWYISGDNIWFITLQGLYKVNYKNQVVEEVESFGFAADINRINYVSENILGVTQIVANKNQLIRLY